MRIGLQTWGTEGDLRPFLALGQALQRRGHKVKLVYTNVEGRDFSGLAAKCGVATRFIDDGYFITHREELGRRASESLQLGSPRKQFELILHDLMDPVIGSMLEAARSLAEECDVVVGHFFAYTAATAAEASRKPYVMLALQPVFATAHYPPAGAPALGRLLNPLLWKLADHVMQSALRQRVNDLRVRCGLLPQQRFKASELGNARKLLVAVSPTLLRRPPDWDSRIVVSGFLNIPESGEPWVPAPDVQAFLEEAAPVFLSFGSMFALDERQTLAAVQTFAAALTLARARGIVQAPAAILAHAPRQENLCYIERAPHDQLFPRCSAIVHHGGAGTTQSALLAGKPSVVVPHAADQFFWGDLLHAGGAGTRTLKRPALTAKSLAGRLRAVLDDGALTTQAAEYAAALRGEDGAERTADLVESVA